jgi:RimJ/RimL family protein N-acetyltransferase
VTGLAGRRAALPRTLEARRKATTGIGYDRVVTKRTPSPTEIRTERLLLRPPRLEDVDAYFALVNDPEYAFFGSRQGADRASTERGLARIIATPWEQRPELAIVLSNELVGRVVLEVDRANETAALGYGVARTCWGRGVATEAARAMMEYGFEGLGLAKVWARADPRNTASVRVLEKIGMVREGLLRSHLVVRGERVDRVYYGLLREEWETTQMASRGI